MKKSISISTMMFLSTSLLLSGCDLSGLRGTSPSSADAQTYNSGSARVGGASPSNGPTSVSGTEIVLAEINDSAPDSGCQKPGADNLVSVNGDQDGQVWITTAKQDALVQSVPTSLVYIEYAYPDDSGSLTIAKTYSLTCTEDAAQEDSENAVFQCGDPYETSPVAQAVQFLVQDPTVYPTVHGQMSVEVHQVTFENPSCNRTVTYQNEFVGWSGTDTIKPGLNGHPFPLYYDKNG